jgi:acetoin utilization deacetylase AcuC-like enzyme
MGFCVFNNAAIAARAYIEKTGRRVLLVDFDYHHGNGTQDVVGDGLSYVSTHASPAYPGTGYELGEYGDDILINLPLRASGVSTEAFVAAWESLLSIAVARVRPDAIVVSAGFDYVSGDPVGDLGVGVEAATSLARAINRSAAAACGGRVAYVLEGGYAIDALADSIARISSCTDAGDFAEEPAEIAALPARERELVTAIGERFRR